MGRVYRKPYRYKKKKSFLRNRFLWFGFFAVLAVYAISYFLFFSETFRVKEVTVTGEQKVSKEQIISTVPLKNIILLNLREIREEILNKFPQIADLEISREYSDTLNLVILERLGVASLCQEEKCFLLDQEGIIFEMSEVRSPVIRGAEQGSLGEKVIEKEVLSQILEVNFQLKNLEIPVREFVIVAEDKLVVQVEGDWQIYLNLQKDMEWQITKLRAVLEEKIPVKDRNNLEYIELRFGNFAPYKLKD